MDVERTIEFILKLQARAELRAEKAEARMDRANARMDRADARVDKLDKRLEGIAKLIRQGMVMLSKTNEQMGALRQSQKEVRRELKQLAAAQRSTERSLKTFIDSMTSGRNGRSS
jgi:chromosome segregation ATPase